MNMNKHPIDSYKKFLLNRTTTTPSFMEFVENLVSSEDESIAYRFHKIMVHGWPEKDTDILFDVISEHFSSSLVPVNVSLHKDIKSFYTSNLNLILRLMRLDFMFPYKKNMFNIDVLFNEKTTVEYFDNSITIADVVASVLNRRFNEHCTLNLSNFSMDPEFIEKKIHFYKVSLLSNFKLLMLRFGKETSSLNLSNNNLTQPPSEVMNFFIKGDLTEINLSYNKIHSLSDLHRVSSKIEKLWLEGNPLCDCNEPSMYIKHITMKFPRLTELDGVKFNEFGLGFPFNRNFLRDSNKVTRMVVEKFLTLYFSHYDSNSRKTNIEEFYEHDCTFTLTNEFPASELASLQRYSMYSRNLLKIPQNLKNNNTPKLYKSKHVVMSIFSKLPKTIHDPTTFTIDVLQHDRKCLILIVDGLFKDTETGKRINVFHFRRTFVFSVLKSAVNTIYRIKNEMFHITLPTVEQLDNSFKHPIRTINSYGLINPERDEIDTIVKIFGHITHMKKKEAEIRLQLSNWDIVQALNDFIKDFTKNAIPESSFYVDDDFSDSSSHVDEDMVD